MSVVARIIGTIIRETWGGVNTSTPGDVWVVFFCNRLSDFRLRYGFVRACLGALTLALFFRSAPFPDWNWGWREYWARQWWRTQSATVTSTLPDGIRNGHTQKQKHPLNVTDCPGLISGCCCYPFAKFISSSQAMCSIHSSRIGVDSQRNLISQGARATHSDTISSILPFRSLMKLLLGACLCPFPH